MLFHLFPTQDTSRLLKNPTFDAGADGKFDYDARNIE